MLKGDLKTKPQQLWNEEKPRKKRIYTSRQAHKETQELRNISKIYGKAPLSDVNFDFIEDFWE